jgi:hypothetical protein
MRFAGLNRGNHLTKCGRDRTKKITSFGIYDLFGGFYPAERAGVLTD